MDSDIAIDLKHRGSASLLNYYSTGGCRTQEAIIRRPHDVHTDAARPPDCPAPLSRKHRLNECGSQTYGDFHGQVPYADGHETRYRLLRSPSKTRATRLMGSNAKGEEQQAL